MWTNMARKAGNRSLRRRFVVLGDGQTEQYYLKHLKEIKGYKYSIRPHFFSSITIEDAELIIDELLSGGCDYIVYLTDFDTIVKQKQIHKFNEIVSKYKTSKEVLICESMPSIEFWFLLHYMKTTRIFQSSDEVVKALKRYIPDFSKERSYLENMKWVENLCQGDRMTSALMRAVDIMAEKDQNHMGEYFPYTKVGKGIDWFERKNI